MPTYRRTKGRVRKKIRIENQDSRSGSGYGATARQALHFLHNAAASAAPDCNPAGGHTLLRARRVSRRPACPSSAFRPNASQLARLSNSCSNSQLADGAWPAFRGDTEGSWTTSLALSTIVVTNHTSEACQRALKWLLAEKGEEGHWLWRWKFKTVDRNVRFDPDKYGWPWNHGAGSWVIPTAFSLIAIKQYTVCARREASEARIRLGVEMLFDRACVDGGWNSGNSIVYGVPLRPHVEATAIALLALQDERRNEVVDKSLLWLRQRAATVRSASSLAWTILSLFTYRESIQQLQDWLSRAVSVRLFDFERRRTALQ